MADNDSDDGNIYPMVNKWNGRLYSKRYFERLGKRMRKLQVWQHGVEFLPGLEDNQTLILVAETSGMLTTQIPQFVLEVVCHMETTPLVDKLPNQKTMVACVQSCAMTTIYFSYLVALEMEVTVGEEVGYTIDSHDCTSAKTVLKYLTANVLLKESVTDPYFKNYKVIILDDAHEESLVKGVLFDYLKKVLKDRPDLKLVVMSGTITGDEKFMDYFSDAPLLKVHGGCDGNLYPMVNKWNGCLYSKRYFETLGKRMRQLRVWQHGKEFLQGFKDNQTLILAAETSGGKTTQIPQFVLDAVYLIETTPPVDKLPNQKIMVACTQSCPTTTIYVSHLVALEMDVTIGEEVGYGIGSQDCTSAKTVLKYLPDYLLLREAVTDPFLKNYKVIILDDAHERTLVKDVLFGYLKELLKHRPDLKLVVMSGTITENKKFEDYFSDATLVKVHGGHHVVEYEYLREEPDEEEGGYLEEAIKRVVQIHMDEDPGDILVFLAEEEEIEYAGQEIFKRLENMVEMYGHVRVVQLYSISLTSMQHIHGPAPPAMEEGDPPGRKIVVTTNIAETSLTIRGIVYVVDCGYARQKIYNHQVHAESVQVSLISKESAEERSRHAGRTRPGKCFRLYTQMMYNKLQKQTHPEIKRSNLTDTVVTLKQLGFNDLERFDFMDPPDSEVLRRALEVLNNLGALDGEGKLTNLGKIMSQFPLDPQMSKMLVGSPGFNCSNEIVTISAMLSAPNCFVRPWKLQADADKAKARFCHLDGDHLTLLNVYHAYKQNKEDPSWFCDNFVNAKALRFADYLRQELMFIMSRFNLELCSTDLNSCDYHVNIRKAIMAGFFMQVAHLNHSGHYLTMEDDQEVTLHPSSFLDHKPEWVVYNEYVLASRNLIRTVTPVCGEWLGELAPHYYSKLILRRK